MNWPMGGLRDYTHIRVKRVNQWLTGSPCLRSGQFLSVRLSSFTLLCTHLNHRRVAAQPCVNGNRLTQWTRKAQLTQKGTHDSDARLKAHCKQIFDRSSNRHSARCIYICQMATPSCMNAAALEMCVATQNRQKNLKTSYFCVQGHPRSLISVAIESQCTTSY